MGPCDSGQGRGESLFSSEYRQRRLRRGGNPSRKGWTWKTGKGSRGSGGDTSRTENTEESVGRTLRERGGENLGREVEEGPGRVQEIFRS